jgi:serine phosphatase RsbU (regulator of sigma subunit)
VINEFIYKTVNTCSSVFVMSADTAIEEFKKTFHINTDVSDVNFRKLNVEPYNSLEQNHQFGEKICLLYQIELIVFNIEIHLRILSFKYEDHVEVLKLEIKVLNDLLAREIAACKNFLQRKRVMNLTFEVLIKFAQLFEMRRLICQTVFRKQTNVTTITDDTGIIVKCCSDDRKVKYLELNWTISWNVEQYEF